VSSTAQQSRPEASRCKVLVAEDEVLVRLMLADELRKSGFQGFEAADAEEAQMRLGSVRRHGCDRLLSASASTAIADVSPAKTPLANTCPEANAQLQRAAGARASTISSNSLASIAQPTTAVRPESDYVRFSSIIRRQ
jgi:hypothetical protein